MPRARRRRLVTDPLVWGIIALALLVALMPTTAPVFAWAFPDVQPPVYGISSFLDLLLAHAAIVAESSAVSTVIAIGLAVLVTRPQGRAFRPMLDTIATIGQSFPPVAILALAVPAVGYGALPTLCALTIYGLLPIIENTLAGLESVPPATREAAEAMGMTKLQLLRHVELPLAAPVILAGVRTSVIINIGTAAIGSTVGAVTLGTPIIDGLVSDKLPYVLQGAVVTALFAILADSGFERLAQRLRVPPA
ncbi:MAG TPA: ABC transporter permease [Stellaceae bacterium]|nr:ABC transporter permease [Stellaceae bacterium]